MTARWPHINGTPKEVREARAYRTYEMTVAGVTQLDICRATGESTSYVALLFTGQRRSKSDRADKVKETTAHMVGVAANFLWPKHERDWWRNHK